MNSLLCWSVTLLMLIQTPYYLSHCCKFGACQKGEPAGRILDDFGNFLKGFEKTHDWSSWILNECNLSWIIVRCRILSEVSMINTAPHSAVSPQMCKKYKRFVGAVLWSKHVERKKFGLICFSRIYFPRLIYCDQEPLRLLNVIENDCYILGVHS